MTLILSSNTSYTSLCVSSIRRDHKPCISYFNASGFPIPSNGDACAENINFIIRLVILRSCSIHHAKSSNPFGVNSKFLTGFPQWYCFGLLARLKDVLLHCCALHQIRGFLFGSDFSFDFSPRLDGNHGCSCCSRAIRKIANINGCDW